MPRSNHRVLWAIGGLAAVVTVGVLVWHGSSEPTTTPESRATARATAPTGLVPLVSQHQSARWWFV
jgi:hypothetical protein